MFLRFKRKLILFNRKKSNITNNKYKKILNILLKTFKRNSFIVLVICPVVVCAIYYSLIAAPRYESYAVVSLRQNDTAPVVDGSIAGILGGGSSPNVANSYLLIDFLSSVDMLNELQANIDIKSYYQSHKIDWFSRLGSDASMQDFLDYYGKMVSANYSVESNSITIKAQGFTGEQAKNILEAIIKNSQATLDHIEHTLAKNRMKFSYEQLEIIKKQEIEAQELLINFQNKKGVVDPEGTIISKSKVVDELQGKIASAETNLTSLKLYLNDGSAQVKTAEQEVKALKQQIAKEKRDFLNSSHADTSKEAYIGDLISKYQWLKLNVEFKMTEYKTALKAFETSKIDAIRQQSYLVEIIKPTTPDTPQYPRILYNLLTILIILSVLYGLGRMIVTIIIENR